jgi:hypothetical protein
MLESLLLVAALSLPAAWSQTASGCTPQDVSLGGTISGQLTAGGCKVSAVVNVGSSAAAQVYRFSLTQRGTVTLDITAAFEPRLYLLDARGNFYSSSHRTSGPAMRIFEALEPGTYQLAATGPEGATGSFQIATVFRNSQTCPVTQIALDSSQSGTLDAGSCRVGDLMWGSGNENFARQFRFSLTQRGTVTVEASSATYEPRVYILDSRYNFVSSSRATGYSSTRTFESLDPGTYEIMVMAQEGASGAFSFQAVFRNPQICAKASHGLTASAGGQFSTSNCRLGDLMFGNSNQGFAFQYPLAVTQRGTLTVDLNSDAVRPAVYLTDARYNFVGSSRLASSTRAHLFEALEPGNYVVIVFAQPGETGAYTVQTDFRNPDTCPSENIFNNSADVDALTAGSCKVGDLMWGSSNENYAKQYRIRISQRTKLVAGMQSDDFDSFLYLTDSRFNFISSDDNSGQGFGARITETLDAGDYVVIAAARNGATGKFTLSSGSGATPEAAGTVYLLLHGLNSDPGTWDRFVQDAMAGDCPVLTDEVIRNAGAPVSRCYRYAFGATSSGGFDWAHGDGFTYAELGTAVGAAVDYIRGVANPLNLILAGHSRGGLAARAYLQTLKAPQPIRFGLLTIGTPHQGSPFGRIGAWLKDQGFTPDSQKLFHDSLYFLYSPSTRYLATASDSSGKPVRNSVSQPVWDLNDGAPNLNGVVSVYGQIASGGLDLGSYPVPGANVNLLGGTSILPGDRDQMLKFVVENLSPDWRSNGDGIVPAAAQRMANIPGFKLGAELWYLDMNRVFHTQETDYNFDILRLLNRMRASLAPATSASALPAPPKVQPRAAAVPRQDTHDSAGFTSAVLRALKEEQDPQARGHLYGALARNGSAASVEALFRLAAASRESRALALDALAAIDRSGAVDTLAGHAEKNSHPELRAAAIQSLGRLHTGEASEALLHLAVSAAGDRDPVLDALADLPSLKSVQAAKKAVAEFPFRSEAVRQRLRAMVEQRERSSTPLREEAGGRGLQ